MMADSHQYWSDFDSSSSRLGSAASFCNDSVSFSSEFLTENSSVFSMSEDDFDQIATQKAKEMFDEVDKALYDDCYMLGSSEVIRECQEWKMFFPHLRIAGKKILESDEQGFKRYSPANGSISSRSRNYKNNVNNSKSGEPHSARSHRQRNGLSVKGEKLDSNALPVEINMDVVTCEEEVIECDGDYEEIFALDYNTEEKRRKNTSRGYPPITPADNMKDCIMSSLINVVLNNISPVVTNLLLESNNKQKNKQFEVESRNDFLKVPCKPVSSSSLLSPVWNKNNDETTFSLNLLASHNSRSFSFRPFDLQAVPEDPSLEGILNIKQCMNDRQADDILQSFPRYNNIRQHSGHSSSTTRLHNSNYNNTDPLNNEVINNKLAHLHDNFKQKLTILPETIDCQKVSHTGKIVENGRTLPQRAASSKQKKALPRIQNKSHTAYNSSTNGSIQPFNRGSTQRATSALHSNQSQPQKQNDTHRFGDKLFTYNRYNSTRPSSTHTYYNNKLDSHYSSHIPFNTSRTIVLPELVEQKVFTLADSTAGHSMIGHTTTGRDSPLKQQLNKHGNQSKMKTSTFMPHIKDSYAGIKRNSLASNVSKSRVSSVLYH